MPRFFFHLTSVNRNIADDTGKEFGTLNDAYDHARKLIDKILLYVGSDDVNSWKVIVCSDKHSAHIVVPFSVSCSLPADAGAEQFSTMLVTDKARDVISKSSEENMRQGSCTQPKKFFG